VKLFDPTELLCEFRELLCEFTELFCEFTELFCEFTELLCEFTELDVSNLEACKLKLEEMLLVRMGGAPRWRSG
jgi:hypothetical protein